MSRVLVDDLKKRVTEAMKSGDTVARDVLRLALGEIQTAEARKGDALSDADAQAAVRKLIKSNQETLGLTTDGAAKAALEREIEVLESLLPAKLSLDAIVELLAPVREAIVSAKSDGQATGVAMKHLKPSGVAVDGGDVGAAVKAMRG